MKWGPSGNNLSCHLSALSWGAKLGCEGLLNPPSISVSSPLAHSPLQPYFHDPALPIPPNGVLLFMKTSPPDPFSSLSLVSRAITEETLFPYPLPPQSSWCSPPAFIPDSSDMLPLISPIAIFGHKPHNNKIEKTLCPEQELGRQSS